jgi:peptide/nickel transport system substrate-binding protein
MTKAEPGGTAEDVKFTFERYKGASTNLLKTKVKEIQTPAPNRVRIVLKEPWPDFMASTAPPARIVPKRHIDLREAIKALDAPVGDSKAAASKAR